jgi:hypothetical protein
MKQPYLDDRDVREVWQEFKRLWWEKAERDSLRLLKVTLERFTEEELVRQIGAGWYVHSSARCGYHSGTRLRRVITSRGTLELEIPKVRKVGVVKIPGTPYLIFKNLTDTKPDFQHPPPSLLLAPPDRDHRNIRHCQYDFRRLMTRVTLSADLVAATCLAAFHGNYANLK